VLYQQSTTWSGAGVDISLDNLSPAAKFQRTAAPSMIQLQQGQPTQTPAMQAPMTNLTQSMGQMNLGGVAPQPHAQQHMMGMMGQPGVMAQSGMMGQAGALPQQSMVGGQPSMMMSQTTTKMTSAAQFQQQRTNSPGTAAFSEFGNFTK